MWRKRKSGGPCPGIPGIPTGILVATKTAKTGHNGRAVTRIYGAQMSDLPPEVLERIFPFCKPFDMVLAQTNKTMYRVWTGMQYRKLLLGNLLHSVRTPAEQVGEIVDERIRRIVSTIPYRRLGRLTKSLLCTGRSATSRLTQYSFNASTVLSGILNRCHEFDDYAPHLDEWLEWVVDVGHARCTVEAAFNAIAMVDRSKERDLLQYVIRDIFVRVCFHPEDVVAMMFAVVYASDLITFKWMHSMSILPIDYPGLMQAAGIHCEPDIVTFLLSIGCAYECFVREIVDDMDVDARLVCYDSHYCARDAIGHRTVACSHCGNTRRCGDLPVYDDEEWFSTSSSECDDEGERGWILEGGQDYHCDNSVDSDEWEALVASELEHLFPLQTS